MCYRPTKLLIAPEVFAMDSPKRRDFLLAHLKALSQTEKTVFKKIVRLAACSVKNPVHVIMAVSKAARFQGIDWLCKYVIQCRLFLSVAKFWGHSEKIEAAHQFLADFKWVCMFYLKGEPAIHALPMRNQWSVFQKKGGVYQGKTIPFRPGSRLRARVLEFKHRLAKALY